MKALQRMLQTVMMLCILATGAFAQKGQGGGDKRPPKGDGSKVVTKEKEGPPPNNRQQNENRGGDKNQNRP